MRREVDAQFKGTVLGYLWAFARPLLMLVVYTFVFGVIFRRDAEGEPLGAYAVSMFCGLTIYNVFSSSLNASCTSVVNRRGFVQQVVFPLQVLPLVQVLATCLLSIPWFLLLFLGVFLVHGTVPITALLLPIWLVPLFLLTQGLSWFVASLGVYFRDIKQFLPIVLQILFFVSPIFWRLDPIRERHPDLVPYLQLNPLTVIIEETRKLVFAAQCPDWSLFGIVFLASAIAFVLGRAWFQKTKKGFADVI